MLCYMDCSASVPMFPRHPWELFQHDNGQTNVKSCVPALPERYLLNGQADVDFSPDGC